MIADSWCSWLVLNGILFVPVAMAVWLLSRWSKQPALCHALWVLALVKLLMPPLIVFPIEYARDTTAAPAAEELTATWLGADSRSSLSSHNVAHRRRSLQPTPPATRTSFSYATTPAVFAAAVHLRRWAPSVATIWALVTACYLIVLARRSVRFHHYVRFASNAPAGLQRQSNQLAKRYGLTYQPRVRLASGRFPPLVWVSPWNQTIVLPAELIACLDEAGSRYVLAHELAHLARRDHWVRRLECVVLALYWWHPAVWWARRQLQHVEEQCCDSWVTWVYPQERPGYARTLLKTLDFLSPAGSNSPAVGPVPALASGLSKANMVRRRFDGILYDRRARKLSTASGACIAAIGISVLPCSASLLGPPTTDSLASAVNQPVGLPATNPAVVNDPPTAARKPTPQEATHLPSQTVPGKASSPRLPQDLDGSLANWVAEIARQEGTSAERAEMIRSAVRLALRHGLRQAHDAWQDASPQLRGQLQRLDVAIRRVCQVAAEPASDDWDAAIDELMDSVLVLIDAATEVGDWTAIDASPTTAAFADRSAS